MPDTNVMEPADTDTKQPAKKSAEDNTPSFSTRILNSGFIVGLILAGICLLMSGYYMIKFQSLTSSAVNDVISHTMSVKNGRIDIDTAKEQYAMIRLALSIHMYIARVLLLSCGIFTGLAFGFLGFSLFLIGVKGNVDVDLNAQDRYKMQVARLSPGLFVILCSAVLIILCATRSLPVSFSNNKSGEDNIFNIPDLRTITQDSIPRDTTMPQ